MNGGTVSFFDDLKAAKTAEVPFEDVPVLLNGNPYTLRFRQMNGFDWVQAVDRNPVRADITVDAMTGYNARGLVLDVAPLTGVLLEDDSETVLPADDWSELLSTLSGADFETVTNAMWRLNDAIPKRDLAAAVERAKKARPKNSKASD